jgi:hypothetical protein
MPDIFDLSISTSYAAGISFGLSKKASGNHFTELNGDRVEIKAAQKRVHVLLGQVPNDPKQVPEQTLLMAQEFLDDLAVRFQLSYRLLTSDDYIFWQRSGIHHSFEINTTLPFTTGGAANAQIVRSDGSIQLNTPIPPLQAKAFRYYRFASSSEDLFESCRYLYLCLECALYDFFPNQPRQPIGKWLKAALRSAKGAGLLDLSAFSVHGSDPIEGFYKAHYKAIRCATFHAQDTPLLPGNPADTTRVSEQLRLLCRK